MSKYFYRSFGRCDILPTQHTLSTQYKRLLKAVFNANNLFILWHTSALSFLNNVRAPIKNKPAHRD